MTRSAVILLSGGLDSTVLAYQYAHEGYALHTLSLDYGQRHRRELQAAVQVAANLGATFDVVDLSALRSLLGGSALTDPGRAVPYGHYAAPTMAQTVVPNRNAILLNVAIGVAVARGAEVVATAVHSGDHAVYPDCRPEFINQINALLKVATEGFRHLDLRVEASFMYETKADIVRLGAQLGVPFGTTWSCYEGRDVHCGQCGTCYERREAFTLAGVYDPTQYAAEPALK